MSQKDWQVPFIVSGTGVALAPPQCQGQTATIVDDSGAHYVYGTSGVDVIYADDGGDHVYGYQGNDVICGGTGGDVITGYNGDDNSDGEDGGDDIFSGGGQGRIRGFAGGDNIYGTDDNDPNILGGDDKDWISLYSGSGDDASGEGGDDYILSGDTARGGAGNADECHAPHVFTCELP